MSEEKVVKLDSARKGSGGNGGGGLLGERLARIEAGIPYLATKEDVAKVNATIQKEMKDMLRWLIGLVAVALVALGIAVVRTFMA